MHADGRLRTGSNRGLRTAHAGFTLVELLVALTISALVVLVAHQLFTAVADRGKALVVARTNLDRSANARRWLKAAFLSLDVGTEGASGFEGRPDRMTFSSWLLTPDGWFERRQVTLRLAGQRLVASVTPGTLVPLMDSIADVQIDYLLDPGADSRWVREWVSPVSAPLAVRLRVERAGNAADTLLFLIKERG